MYKNLKLEKGMYHITGKSFSEVLESMDPSGQYDETPLAGLDAYERQLKRFDIRVSGPHCDRVEKFFSTTESAVLFPEFVRRAVTGGVEQSVLSEITAVHTFTESGNYMPGVFSDTAAYGTKVAQGTALPTATYYEATSAIRLDKYGRSIHASYEAIRRQRLDAFAKVLRGVGVRLAAAVTLQAVKCLEEECDGAIDKAGTELAYSDLAALYGTFKNFNMDTILASPAVAAKIMAMDQMKEMASTQPNTILLPFGARLKKCAGMAEDMIIGLDSNFGLEMITASELLLETDKLIDSQLDVITVSLRAAFRVLTTEAVQMLTI